MRKIRLLRGGFVRVDDRDFKWLNKWLWGRKDGYAVRYTSRLLGKQRTIYMHREIVKTSDGMQTDHRDLDRLNNQRKNLRACTVNQNRHNQNKHRNNVSGYKGVSWHRDTGKWTAQIGLDGIRTYLGVLADVKDAARA